MIKLKMAAKRTATTDLNHENWDAEEDSEEPGTFKRVSNEELKNRVIRKAKRSAKSNSSGGISLQSSSPFAAFSGFSGGKNPFSQKTDNRTSESNPLLSGAQNAVKKENEKSANSQENQSEKDNKTPTTTATKPGRDIEYYRQLQSLNESVMKWMQIHLAKNSCSDFTPVFNDYKKHLETLNLTYPAKEKDSVCVKMSASNKNLTHESGDNSCKNKDADTKIESNNNKNGSKDETDYGAHFSANTTNTSTFSFGCGIKCSGTATSSITPLGPTSSSKEEEKTKPFQFTFGDKSNKTAFGSTSGFSFASAIAAKSAEPVQGEEENYEPPKNDFVAVAEEDALYSKKCKLFFKKDDSFADKGVGMLYLKSLEGKTQLLVRADTNLGNILLNIMLSSSLPMSRTGKNNVLIVCVPNPPVDAKNPDSKEAIPMLIRVKTAEDADELLEALNKHKS